ncbi:MAG: energy-coupling factor transporter transmembrane component T [Thermomicrobiales bacterium]
MMASNRAIDPAAWLLWFLAAGAIPLTSRQPLYLALILLAVVFVHLAFPHREGHGRSWRLFAYIGSSVAVLSIGFNVLTVHSGDRPFAELPGGLPIIGGQLTYNALVYGVASALAISSLLFAAATFNTAVRHADLIRRLPRPFQRLGVAGAIALNFVPQTMQAGRDIYDTQRTRGRTMRGVRDARAFVVPLLGNGLERAFQMSEAMETRGYGSRRPGERDGQLRRLQMPVAVALIILALPLVATGRLLPALVIVMTALMLLGGVRPALPWRWRIDGWSRPTIGVAIPSCMSLAVVAWRTATGHSIAYSPFPRLVWPDFDLVIGLAICLLLAPAIVAPGVDDD